MSEEYLKNQKRIAKVEKEIHLLKDFQKLEVWSIRLEELEAKVETLDLEKKLKIDYMLKMNQLVENDKTHQALYDKIFKEIAELEKYRKADELEIVNNTKEIAELTQNVENWENEWVKWDGRINELKEAFKKREEHDCYKEWTKNIKVHNLDELVPKTEKKDLSWQEKATIRREKGYIASGGDSTDDSKVYHPDQTTDDSITPEPKYTYGDARDTRTYANEEPREDEPNRCVVVDYKVCMTCSIDLTHEPRLEVHMCGICADNFGNKDYIGVKREDLQFLYKLVDNELPEYIPKIRDRIIKIKEEYSL